MQFFFDHKKKSTSDLARRIELICEKLVYMSETDAAVSLFTAGPVRVLDAETMRSVTSPAVDVLVEEVDAGKFFARLTHGAPWHNEEMRTRKEKFLELHTLVEENLQELKVFKIGEVRVRIYAVGLDDHNNIIGVETEAVET